MPDKGPIPHPTMLDICISKEDVEKMLQNDKPDKAAGPDSLPATVLKELSHEIAHILALSPVTGKLPILHQSLRKVTNIKSATIGQCP